MRAIIRCIADLIFQGFSKKEIMARDLGTHITGQRLSEARHWLYKDAHGVLQRHRPLRQPFPYKELTWDPERKTLMTVARKSALTDGAPEPRATADGSVDPESLRISYLMFAELLHVIFEPRARQTQNHESTDIISEPPPPREREASSVAQPATSTYSLVMRDRPRHQLRDSSSSMNMDLTTDVKMAGIELDSESSDDPANMEIHGDTLIVLRDMGTKPAIDGGKKRKDSTGHGYSKKVDAKVRYEA
ncbi:MAG: hypothetical protein Q9208_001204 [Pyrenodesmia sp. 3 TL-2023]